MNITLLIPCRNEQGTISTAIELGLRLPGVNEIIVIEGHSIDRTYQTAIEVSEKLKTLQGGNIQVIQQSKVGKWNAVQEGMSLSKNDSIAIWDADLTVSFSEQCLIHERYISNIEHLGKTCLATGNRMALREAGSMRFLNQIGNSFFSKIWSILGRRYIPDLLCGSKVFSKTILTSISQNLLRRDPYGDFTIFAAAITNGVAIEFQNLTYRARSYGQTNILRWSGGLRLLDFTLRFFIHHKLISKFRILKEK